MYFFRNIWTFNNIFYIFSFMMKVIFIFVFQLIIAVSAKAFDPNYNPFTEKELKQIKATSLSSNLKSDVNCVIKRTSDSNNRITIYYRGKTVYEELFDYAFSYNNKLIISDIDSNGLDDVIKYYFHGTLGLGLGCDLLIFSQYEKGRFIKLKIAHERFSKEDICDINNDKKKEIINCILVNCNGHNYWVYRCWRLDGKVLKNIDYTTGFPKAVWFTNKPNNKMVSADLLKEIMKNYPKIEDTNDMSSKT
jgi:hypothetical protein